MAGIEESVQNGVNQEQASDSSDNESVASPTVIRLDMTSDSVDKTKFVIDASVYDDMKPLENSIPQKTVEHVTKDAHDSQGTEHWKKELHIQHTSHYSELLSAIRARPKVESESLSAASQGLKDVLCSEDSMACDNSDVTVEAKKKVAPPVPPRSPLKSVISPAKIIITTPSDHDLSLRVGQPERIMWRNSSEMQGYLDVATSIAETVAQATAPPETELSHDIAGGVKGQMEMSDVSTEDTSTDISTCRERLLISTSEETDDELEVNALPSIVRIDTDIAVPQNKLNFSYLYRKGKQEKLSFIKKLQLKRDESPISDIPKVTNRLDPHESMEEIDLNDETFGREFEKIHSTVQDSPFVHTMRSDIGEIRLNLTTKIDSLKQNVIKGMFVHGAKIKEVVNEKLNIVKHGQEPQTSNRSSSIADGMPPGLLPSNDLSCGTVETKPRSMSPCLITVETSKTREQELCDNVAASIPNTPNRGVNVMDVTKGPSLATLTNFSRRNEPSFKSPVLAGSSPHPQVNEMNRSFYSRPAPTVPVVHSTITQSPGPPRGYTSFYPTPYGVHMPPSLPPPPAVPAEDYFASRYYSGQNTVPTTSAEPEQPSADRQMFNTEYYESKITKGVDYMASYVRLKSNRVRDDFNRRLSSSVSHVSGAGPVVDLFMEDGRAPRSSMDSGSDQFQQNSLHTLASDSLLKGALCCCFWPLGLAARLITLTIPDRGGPVDSCIKSMSGQISSISLLLGIATYFVFFLLWLSLLAIAAKK